MIRQKITSAQKAGTPVRSLQLTMMLLVLGGVAGVFASLLLGWQDKLRSGAGFWYGTLIVGLALCAGLGFGYLRTRRKAGK